MNVYPADVDVGGTVAYGRVGHGVAVVVVRHKRVHVSVVVADVYGHRTFVVDRVAVPIPGRTPGTVCVCEQMRKDKGSGVIYRLHIVAGAVDVRIAYNLDIRLRRAGNFRNQSGNILIDVSSEHCLDYKNVVVALYGLKHTEVVHIAVSVEVQVGQYIRRIVDEFLEFLHSGRLGESSAYGLEIEVERDVLADGLNTGSRCHCLCFLYGHSCGVGGVNASGIRC